MKKKSIIEHFLTVTLSGNSGYLRLNDLTFLKWNWKFRINYLIEVFCYFMNSIFVIECSV